MQNKGKTKVIKTVPETIEAVKPKQKIKNLKKSTKNYQINTLFKANVVYALETLAERLSMDRNDIIRLAVEDYLLHSSIRELLQNEPQVHEPVIKKKRAEAQPIYSKREYRAKINIESLRILDKIAMDENVSRSFLVEMIIDSYINTNPDIIKNKSNSCHSSFINVYIRLPIIKLYKLDELCRSVLPTKVPRDYILREIIELFLLETNNGEAINDNWNLF